MSEDCPYCRIINDSKTPRVYEDDKVIVFHSDKPVCAGHLVAMPKKHYPIIELVPDYTIAHLFSTVNKVSIAVFEGLNARGTNLLINNGIAAGQELAHFLINIIPRQKDDGISFHWNPRQMSEEEMSTIELKYKEETAGIGSFEEEKIQPIITEKEIPQLPVKTEENYLIRQLERIP
ncbi:MAG: HIT domain-containing protein [archaeon]